MHVLDTLRERGYIAQVTNEDDLYKKLANEQITLYSGYDPTHHSLHVGHCIPIMVMAHFQRAGHRPIALMGGGTAVVGDPSGRTDLRRMLTLDQIQANVRGIQSQMGRFIDFADGRAILENNADWLLKLNYVEFLREIGVHFSVNRMLTADCYKSRMEKGLTFLEFNYMLMQSYDFLHLNRAYGCVLQVGGDDQWSNILAGADLIRRKEQREAYALTFNLLTMANGQKMGKTAAGALFLDKDEVSPYDFYQYFRNVDDADVQKLLAQLTFLPMDEVRRLGALRDSAINDAKKRLAYEVTTIVHGEEAALEAQRAAEALFGSGGPAEAVPTTLIPRAEMAEGIRVVELLARCSLAKSLGDGRRLIAGGGISLDGVAVDDPDRRVMMADFPAEGILLRKGKKTYHRAVLGE